ncbi:MAG: DMT family transporter [Rikenellaceae bacterium]
MWLLLAFASASLLGLYDITKKRAVTDNAVLPVLLLNTLFSTLIFTPIILDAELDLGWFDGTQLEAQSRGLRDHAMVMLKAVIVLTSWVLGYFAIKHLPLSIVGPINATRPVVTLVGAMVLFSERLNAWQWAGVILTLISLFLLSRSSRKEGIKFSSNHWILMLVLAALVGSISGLYDKYIMTWMDAIFVQGWYNFYQCLIMSVIVMFLWYPTRQRTTRFRWSWAIPLISIMLSCADFAYFWALSDSDAMISIVSMIRRGSVIVSFAYAAMILREKNLKGKALDLLFILIGMIFLYIGSKS